MTAHRDPATILPSLTSAEDRRVIELWARVAGLERENERLRELLDGRLSVSEEHRAFKPYPYPETPEFCRADGEQWPCKSHLIARLAAAERENDRLRAQIAAMSPDGVSE